jgi:hypothetical protein
MSEHRFDLGQLVIHQPANGIDDRRYFQVLQIIAAQGTSKPLYLIRGFQGGPQFVVPEDELRAGTNLGERATLAIREQAVQSANAHESGSREGGEAVKQAKPRTRTSRRAATKNKTESRRKAPQT